MSTSLPLTPARRPLAPLVAFIILVLGALFLQNSVGSRQVLLLVVGAALGLTLYHAAFGFTSAWRVFITERRGDLDARVPNKPGSDLLAAATGLHPVEGAKVNRSVLVDGFVFGDGILVLPATGGTPFERAQAVARQPRTVSAQAPGAQWFPVAEITSVITFDGLRLELRDREVVFDAATYQDYPAHGKATAVARMLLADGRDRATVWGSL